METQGAIILTFYLITIALCGFIAKKKKKWVGLAIFTGLIFGIFALIYQLITKSESNEWKTKYNWYVSIIYFALLLISIIIVYSLEQNKPLEGAEVCESNNFTDQDMTRDKCYSQLAFLKNNIAYCKKIEDQRIKNLCLS